VNELQQVAQRVLAAQPFSRPVGTRLTASGSDHAELSIDVREDLTQQHGFVHGVVVNPTLSVTPAWQKGRCRQEPSRAGPCAAAVSCHQAARDNAVTTSGAANDVTACNAGA
jgi:hypothetical protein